MLKISWLFACLFLKYKLDHMTYSTGRDWVPKIILKILKKEASKYRKILIVSIIGKKMNFKADFKNDPLPYSKPNFEGNICYRVVIKSSAPCSDFLYILYHDSSTAIGFTCNCQQKEVGYKVLWCLIVHYVCFVCFTWKTSTVVSWHSLKS